MKTPAQADLQRWSDEVARDPASLAFLPLARAYRRQGQRAAARQLCIRGLENYPNHAEAHSLLALLYLEDGERTKAADEWSMVLRMDPNHFEALRGIGFCYLEQDQLSRARQALERAALLRPQDAAVQEALKVLGTRQELHAGGAHTNAAPDDILEMDAPPAESGASSDASAASAPAVVEFDEPWAATPVTTAHPAPAPAAPALQPTPAPPPPSASPAPSASAPPAPRPPAVQHPLAQQILGTQPATTTQGPGASQQHVAGSLPADPAMLFDSMVGGGPLLGILLLDAQGLVMAGSLGDQSVGDADALGATLGPAISEASRTVSLLALGDWRGMLLEAGTAVLHVSPVAGGKGFVLLAAKRNAPTGWVLRSAAQAAEIAARYVEEYA
jgi:predicted regulator of Ras-like GTPase activity (Roadblock/LC7/MglB family)